MKAKNKFRQQPVNFLCLILLVIMNLFFAIQASAHTGSHTVTLVYSGNLDGELEPCGCSEGGNKGGIKRIVQKIDEFRQQDPHLYLVSAGGLISSEVPQDKLKAEYILKGLHALNYDAVGVQWKDLSYGEDFIANSKLPFILSNGSSEKFFSKSLINNNHAKIAFFNWLDPDSAPGVHMGSELAKRDTQALEQALSKAKQSKQTTLLSTTLTLEQAQKLMPLNYVDILIIKASYEVFGEVQAVNNTLVLQPGSRGMRLGKMTMEIDSNGKILKWQHEVTPLPPEVKDAERMNAWYDEYNAKVKADYEQRVALRKKLESGKTPFAGEQTCQSCHEKQHSIWLDTRHAEAFYALQDANKAFDPECIKCHTVGFEVEGGFIDPMITEKLMHVQCENCHGAAKSHAETAGKQKTTNHNWQAKQMCAQCHVQKHSPDFNFDSYWPKISHGK